MGTAAVRRRTAVEESGGASEPQDRLSIGEVLALLHADFPEVTVSKVRFLEAEGLVEPERTAANYRQFRPTDVERLQYVLRAQREQFLPLKVIKQHLEAMDRGLEPPAAASAPAAPNPRSEGTHPAAASFERPRRAVRLSREELLQGSGLAPEVLKKLEDVGLVRPASGGWYDADALAVATTAAELAAYGVEPRHLRAFKTAADREAGLVEQAVAPLVGRRDAQAAERAGEVARELAALSVRLHADLLRRALPAHLRD